MKGGGGAPRVPVNPLGLKKKNVFKDYFGSSQSRYLNMKNENVHDLKRSGK